METEEILITTIYYYIREKFYGTALISCEEGCKRYRENHEYVCLKAYCLAKLGKSPEAIRLLISIRKNTSISLAVLVTLRIAYYQETNPNQEAIKELDIEINSLWSNADLFSSYVSAFMLLFEGNADRGRPLIDRHISAGVKDPKVLSLKGWIDVVTSKDIKAAQRLFETAIASSKWPDAYFGQAKIYTDRHATIELQKLLSDLLDEHNTHIPGYIEAIKATIMMRNWDKVTEIAQSASLIQGSDCVAIQYYECGYAILIQGDTINIEQLLSELFESTNRIEQGNHFLNFKFARFLASVSSDSNIIKQYSKKFLDEALTTSKDVDYIAEKSRLLLLDGDTKGALQMAKKAMQDNVEAGSSIIYSIIRCYIATGDIKDASEQLEFMKATHSGIDRTVMFYYFSALIDRSKGQSNDTFLSHMRSAIDAHFSVLQRIPYGLEYVEKLDPFFLIEATSRLFEIAPLAPSKMSDVVLREIIRIMSIVYDNCPGIGRACYFLAKAKFLEMETIEAERLLRNCMSKGSSVAETYLLLAQILLQRHQLPEASKCLDAGLGFSFQVREHPLYFLTKARMLKHEKGKKMEEAITLLKQALDLPVFKDVKAARQMDVSEADRIAIYLEIIDCYQLMGRAYDADNVMKEALNRYTGTQEEEKLVLMNAQLRLQRGDIKGALEVLQSIDTDQPNYQAVRMKMAQIYLEELHDKQRFANCYRDILNADPSPMSYVLVGDAYMSIQEPTRAIEAYETAMRRNPKDHALAEKIGNAYVQCHLYHKAITFYEAAMKTGKQNIMRLRYAEELLRIKNYEKCERILMEVVDSRSDPSDVEALREHVSYWMLLSKLHLETGNSDEAAKDLLKAKQLQGKMLAKSPNEVGNQSGEKKLASSICCKLAELYRGKREYLRAIDFYKEAIEIDTKDVRSMLFLAHIYYTMGKIQQCNQQCQAILSIDKNNNEATLLMADIMYQRSEGDIAMKHFSQLLERNPNQYHSMARCMELHWRKGDLDAAEHLLKKALEANPRANVDAGFNYCKGLLEWYTCDPNSALNYFNRARRDSEWGERAVYNIIEIFLNPDYETLGGEALENSVENDANQAERELNVKSAERFLNEIRAKPGLAQKFTLMENFILLATSNRTKIQQALNNFLDLIEKDNSSSAADAEKPVNVGAVLGASRAYLLLKQSQKAKALLKRLVSYTWSLEDADYLERCWLLLSDVYINQGKTDQATSVLRTVLQYNSSCIKAFEYMGFLRERQSEFVDAAANYECAWRLGKHRNPAVGFKLAFNYLKCRKNFECIEICLAILQTHPDYPKIRREILDKARSAIMS